MAEINESRKKTLNTWNINILENETQKDYKNLTIDHKIQIVSKVYLNRYG